MKSRRRPLSASEFQNSPARHEKGASLITRLGLGGRVRTGDAMGWFRGEKKATIDEVFFCDYRT